MGFSSFIDTITIKFQSNTCDLYEKKDEKREHFLLRRLHSLFMQVYVVDI